MSRLWQIRTAGIVLGLIAILAVGFLAVRLADMDALRSTAERRLSAIAGRDVRIAGDFDLALSLTPRLAADGLSIANARWGSRPWMFEAEEVAVELRLLPLLLDGEIWIDRLSFTGARMLLETGPDGALNWQLGTPEEAPTEGRSPLHAIDEVAIRKSLVMWPDADGGTNSVVVDLLEWSGEDPDGPVTVRGRGTLDGAPWNFDGQIGDLRALITGSEPVSVALEAAHREARLSAEGVVAIPLGDGATRVDIAASGGRLDLVDALTGVRLPDLGSWELSGILAGTEGAAETGEGGSLALTGLSGELGNSDSLHLVLREGAVTDLLDEVDLRLPLTVAGNHFAGAGTAFGLGLPRLGPFLAEGVVEGSLAAPRLVGLDVRLGEAEAPLLQASDGRIGDLARGEDLHVPVHAEGPSLGRTADRLGLDLPDLGAYTVAGLVTGSLAEPALSELSGEAGNPQTGRLTVSGGSIADVLDVGGLEVPFTFAGEDVSWIASAFELGVRPDAARIEGALTGSLDSPGLQGLDATLRGPEGAVLEASGTIVDIPGLSGLDLSASIEGADLDHLASLLPVDLPPGPPARLALHAEGSYAALALHDIEARLGDSRLEGHLTYTDPPDSKPRLEGRLSAERLDFDSISNMFAAAGPEDADGPSPAQDDGLLQRLERANADLALRAEEIVAADRSFTDASARLVLREGLLAVRDLTGRAAGGVVSAEAELDAAAGPVAEVTLALNIENIRLAEVLKRQGPGSVKGVLDVNLNLDSTGQSLDALAEHLDGQVAVFGEEGRVEDLPLNRLVPDLDITRLLPFFGTRETAVRINCMIGEVEIEEGLAVTEALVDTRRMTLRGAGSIDLGDGAIDFALRPVAKSRKLSTVEVPVDVGGTISDPQINPRTGALVGGAARGLLGGLLFPLNQISALFGTEAKDACDEALRATDDGGKGTGSGASGHPAGETGNR